MDIAPGDDELNAPLERLSSASSLPGRQPPPPPPLGPPLGSLLGSLLGSKSAPAQPFSLICSGKRAVCRQLRGVRPRFDRSGLNWSGLPWAAPLTRYWFSH